MTTLNIPVLLAIKSWTFDIQNSFLNRHIQGVQLF